MSTRQCGVVHNVCPLTMRGRNLVYKSLAVCSCGTVSKCPMGELKIKINIYKYTFHKLLLLAGSSLGCLHSMAQVKCKLILASGLEIGVVLSHHCIM